MNMKIKQTISIVEFTNTSISFILNTSPCKEGNSYFWLYFSRCIGILWTFILCETASSQYTVVKCITTIAEDYSPTQHGYQHVKLEWSPIIPEKITFPELVWKAYIFSRHVNDRFCPKLSKDLTELSHKQ